MKIFFFFQTHCVTWWIFQSTYLKQTKKKSLFTNRYLKTKKSISFVTNGKIPGHQNFMTLQSLLPTWWKKGPGSQTQISNFAEGGGLRLSRRVTHPINSNQPRNPHHSRRISPGRGERRWCTRTTLPPRSQGDTRERTVVSYRGECLVVS